MSIDWSATGDMLAGIGAVGGAAAVAVAAFFGRNALREFKSQRQIERQLAHAESILAAAYELQSALDGIRSPLATAAELDQARKELDERDTFSGMTQAEIDRFVQANVFYIRARYFDEEFLAARKLLPFASAFFGKDVKESLHTLIHNRHAVRVYADAYARDLGHDKDFDRKIRAAIWKGAAVDPNNDEVTKSTEAAVATLEQHLFPIIRLDSGQARKAKDIQDG